LYRYLIAIIIFMVVLGGCTNSPHDSSSSSVSEVRPSEAQSEPALSTKPDADRDPEQDFYRKVVMDLGADEHGGIIRPDVISFYYGGNWNTAEGLSVKSYFSWFYAWSYKNGIGDEWRKYDMPGTPELGNAIDADIFEETITKYFDVSVEYLQSDHEVYDAENREYHKGIYFGKGATPEIDILKIEKDADYEYIHITLTIRDGSYKSEPEENVITIRRLEDETYRFVSYTYIGKTSK